MHYQPEQAKKVTPEAQAYGREFLGKIRGIGMSDAYRSRRQAGTPHPTALSEALVDYAGSTPELTDAERSLYVVASKIGTFIDASQQLDIYRDQLGTNKPNQVEKQRMTALKTEHIIPFNHEVKEFINLGGDMPMNSAVMALYYTYKFGFEKFDSLHPGKAKETGLKDNEILYKLQSCLDGMRHELAAESILSAAGIEYDYRNTVDDDAAGNDLFVTLNGQEYGIDIKASEASETKAHNSPYPSYAIWTGLDAQDFTGSKGKTPNALAIPYDRAIEMADWFSDRLVHIIDTNQSRLATRRVIGHQATVR